MNQMTFSDVIILLLPLTAGCAQRQQRHRCQHLFGRTLSHSHVQEKTLVLPLGICNFSEGVCLKFYALMSLFNSNEVE